MRWPAVTVATLAFATSASGTIALSAEEQNTLTAIDSVPTTSEIDADFSDHATALANLTEIAADSGTDIGIRIRTLHALAGYCTPPCGDSDAAHAALAQFITANEADQTTGTTLVMLRSAIEALGPQRVSTDAPMLEALLSHPSRDIRAATAHALRDLCNTTAISSLRTQQGQETSDQVRLAISEALRVLSQPDPCP